MVADDDTRDFRIAVICKITEGIVMPRKKDNQNKNIKKLLSLIRAGTITESPSKTLSLVKKISREKTINYQNAKGNTALNLAAAKGYCNLVELLIQFGADTKHKNNKGSDYLSSFSLATIKLLKKKKYDKAKHIIKEFKGIPFQKINKNNISIKSLLLTQINEHSKSGNLRYLKKIKSILKPKLFKLYINNSDSEGNTPLLHAAEKGNVDIALWLILQGADTNHQAYSKRTYLDSFSVILKNHLIHDRFKDALEIIENFNNMPFWETDQIFNIELCNIKNLSGRESKGNVLYFKEAS